MPYKCIIVDDEPPAIKILTTYVENMPQFQLSGTCKNAFEAIQVLNTEKIDLIFLDIHMPKLIGTELIKALRHPPKVIFTTAHKDFAIEAFELDAIDYLLKPISFERFVKAVNKFCHINSHEPLVDDLNQGFVYFRADRKMIKVFLDDIRYIESLKDYIVIHRNKDEDIKIKMPLGHVETMLPNHLFMRVHRSFIIAINKITAFSKNDIEVGKTEIPIGRSYMNIMEKLNPDHLNLN